MTGIEFVWVPDGCFKMSNYSIIKNNENAIDREICLAGFWMAKTEVTYKQWIKLMGESFVFSNPDCDKDDCPVTIISWREAKEYIETLNQRTGLKFSLPTEAQWEYAASSKGKGEIYSGSNNINEVAWNSENSGRTVHEVAMLKPNDLGLYDMSGNVKEMCKDVVKKQGLGPYAGTRVMKGGSIISYENCSIKSRDYISTVSRAANIGFRLVRNLK